jgi:prolyl-tRNA synthetase
VVESDNGYIGGEYCHEFISESTIGESRYLISPDGQYAAHEDVAQAKKDNKNIEETLKEMEEVTAPRGTTMEDGALFHNLPLWQQIKDVLFVDENGRFILAIIRGDYDVNEVKLKHLTGAHDLRHATEEEIRTTINSEPGFISPVGIKKEVMENTTLLLVADSSLRTVHNSYGGANKKDTDLLNMNIDRDYTPDIEGDIALVRAGDTDTNSDKTLEEKRGIEVGNIFQLGYHYSNLMKGANFVDQDGVEKPYYMGCYGIGIGRTMAAIVEAHHDDKGILWPKTVAPFKAHLIALPGKEPETVFSAADKLYSQLLDANVEVLYDDRTDISAGEKFADSDLIGIPYRIVVSSKTIAQNSVEVKKRTSKESNMVPTNDLLKFLNHEE